MVSVLKLNSELWIIHTYKSSKNRWGELTFVGYQGKLKIDRNDILSPIESPQCEGYMLDDKYVLLVSCHWLPHGNPHFSLSPLVTL